MRDQGRPMRRDLRLRHGEGDEVDVELTVVMPCLNEAETVATCVRKAIGFLDTSGISGEVVVADNGSTDGSQRLAEEAGARVVDVRDKGYGNALMGGILAARGPAPVAHRITVGEGRTNATGRLVMVRDVSPAQEGTA